MTKRLLVLTMVALVALVLVTPAWAAGSGQEGAGVREQQLFSVSGTVTAIGTDTITIVVEGGSWAVWQYIGGSLTVQVTGDTDYFEGTGEGRLIIDFTDVAVDDSVNIQGTVDGDVFTADRVIVE